MLAQESVDDDAKIAATYRYEREPDDEDDRVDPLGEHQTEDRRKDRHQPAIGLKVAQRETQLLKRELVALPARHFCFSPASCQRFPRQSQGPPPTLHHGRLSPCFHYRGRRRPAGRPVLSQAFRARPAADRDIQVRHQPVAQGIDPAMNAERSGARPGVLHEHVGGDIAHLPDDVQFAQPVQAPVLIRDAFKFVPCSWATSRMGCSQWSTRPRRFPSTAAAMPPHP